MWAAVAVGLVFQKPSGAHSGKTTSQDCAQIHTAGSERGRGHRQSVLQPTGDGVSWPEGPLPYPPSSHLQSKQLTGTILTLQEGTLLATRSLEEALTDGTQGWGGAGGILTASQNSWWGAVLCAQ